MSINEKTITAKFDATVLAQVPAIAGALLLGAFLFIGVGFASPMEMHNAAHDARHVFSFPCH